MKFILKILLAPVMLVVWLIECVCKLALKLSSVVFALRDGDEVNKKIRRDLMSRGTVIGQTVMNGRVMLKFTLLNPELTHEHIDELISTIRAYSL